MLDYAVGLEVTPEHRSRLSLRSIRARGENINGELAEVNLRRKLSCE